MLAFRAAFVLPVVSAAFSAITTPTASRSPALMPPVFSASDLVAHGACLEEEEPLMLPNRLDIASPPRSLPKPEPLTGLWDNVPKPQGSPKGPGEYQINVGKAIDVLRTDYPMIFLQKPDLSIFTKQIELWDPSGKRLSGIRQYEKLFDLLIFLRRTTMQDAKVTYRLVVADEKIRVRWSAKLWMRDPALGLTNLMNGEPAVVHIDGVSNYELDTHGKIRRHRLENIMLRGQEEQEPVQLAFAWPSAGLATPVAAIPFFRQLDRSLPAGFDSLFAPSQQLQPIGGPSLRPSKSDAGRSRAPQMSESAETPLERAAREQAEDADKARKLAELRAPKSQSSARGGIFGAMTMPQPCETSFDCERPEVCCDLLFGSVCCSAGLMIPTRDGPGLGLQPQAIPIPVERDNNGPQPGAAPRYPGP